MDWSEDKDLHWVSSNPELDHRARQDQIQRTPTNVETAQSKPASAIVARLIHCGRGDLLQQNMTIICSTVDRCCMYYRPDVHIVLKVTHCWLRTYKSIASSRRLNHDPTR